jgi:predicted AAA+ superfamily ATPase
MTDIRFKTPSSIMISGPSQYGKTVLKLKLLKDLDEMFVGELFNIIYCYGTLFCGI